MNLNRSVRVGFRVAGLLGLFLLAALGGSRPCLAEYDLLPPAKDSTLIESSSGALGNGSGPGLFAGRISSSPGSIRRALIAFDLASAIPPGSTVTRVALSLHLSATNAGPFPVRLHRILADWGEGASFSSGGGGAPSVPGDSTWIHRFFDDAFWTQAGGDFDPIPRAVALVDQPGFYSWGSTPEMVADVQSWLAQPEGNYGWILVGDESLPTTVKRFDSREHPEEAGRPVLNVEYVPPCSPEPRGPGYWKHQCSGLIGGGETDGKKRREQNVTEPRFADRVLPCADKMLGDLNFPAMGACDALGATPPPDCRDRALRKLSVLVLNVCAGRLQTSCPVPSGEGDCVSTNLGDYLRELSLLILRGDCRRASDCAGLPD